MQFEEKSTYTSQFVQRAEQDAEKFQNYLDEDWLLPSTRERRKDMLKALNETIGLAKKLGADYPLLGLYDWIPDAVGPSIGIIGTDRYTPLLTKTRTLKQRGSIKIKGPESKKLISDYNIMSARLYIAQHNNKLLLGIAKELKQTSLALLDNKTDKNSKDQKEYINKMKLEGYVVDEYSPKQDTKQVVPIPEKNVQKTFSPLQIDATQDPRRSPSLRANDGSDITEEVISGPRNSITFQSDPYSDSRP